MTRVSRRVLMTMAVLALAIGAGSTLALLGCGSDGGGSDLVGPAEDIVLFPGGDDGAKPGAPNDEKAGMDYTGINLGTSGYFHYLDVSIGDRDNHWFMTKASVSYQVEVIAYSSNANVDLYVGRNAKPYSNGYWRASTRMKPLMDGIVFKSTRDGIMYVDVAGSEGPTYISYHIHVRKCQFGAFNQ